MAVRDPALPAWAAKALLAEGVVVQAARCLGAGDDHRVWLVNERLAVRVARRAGAARRLPREAQVLALVRDAASAPVPQARLLVSERGQAALAYPLLPGTPLRAFAKAPAVALTDAARFLTALHAIPVARARAAGLGPFVWSGARPHAAAWSDGAGAQAWRAGLVAFVARVRRRLHAQDDPGLGALVAELEAMCAQGRHFAFAPVLLHGDFAPEHVLTDPVSGRLTGVLDFGDAGLGDPAYDVAPELLEAYGGALDPTFAWRSRFYRRLGPLHALAAARTRIRARDG